jgi:hypothetical protein
VGRLQLAGPVGQALVLRPRLLQRRAGAAVVLPARQWRAHHRCSPPAARRAPGS